MQRMQRLLEHEAVSRQEFESAQTRYAQVKSAYENSLGLLKETKLRAPFASVVERKFVDNYERVQAGQSIVRVVNPVTTKVQFTMPGKRPVGSCRRLRPASKSSSTTTGASGSPPC